ncbi:MAG: S1 RNA-binding domain-containing protein [Candidatus Velthaea sp.]|jgi:small subunit ribosomal protein S1
MNDVPASAEPAPEPTTSVATLVADAHPVPLAGLEPFITDPLVTEPLITEPLITEPLIVEPLVTEPPSVDLPNPEAPGPESSLALAPADAPLVAFAPGVHGLAVSPPVPGLGAPPEAVAAAAAPPPAAGPAAEASVPEPPATAAVVTAAAAAPPKPKPAPKPPVDPAVLEERRRKAKAAWDRVVAAKASNDHVTGYVLATTKGGWLVDVDAIRGFLPASQGRLEAGATPESLLKTRIPLRVLDIDETRRRIVVSHRRALDDDRRAKRTELLQVLRVGEVREATVARLTDFGAFVDLGGIDGLIPMRELAFDRVEKVSDVLSIGEKLMVEVLRIEEDGKKISLSRKNALPDPWRDHGDLVRPGATVEGKVVATVPRLQVELAPGIVGSLREGDANPADYKIGETIEVRVRNVDRKRRSITLSTAEAAVVYAPSSSGFAPLGIELKRR